ncbi:O-antigen ligase domain-containing protein [Alcaligenes faecalis]|nr:O-antigen ligase domain-containing protein [Alcaligenes faecalis]
MSSVALRIGPDALYDFVAKVTFFAFFVFGPVWKFLETMFAFPRVNVSAIYLLCTLVLLLLLLVKAAFSARRLQGKPVFVAISILLLWVLAIQILQFFSLLQQVDWWTLLRYFSNTGVSPILLTLLGKWYAENEEGSARTVRVSWLCSTVIYVFSYFYIGQDFHREIVEASVYLTLSDCYAIVSLLLLVSVRNKTQAALFLAISFWVLFFLNSRFSFIAFVFACMVIMFVRNKLAAIVMVLLAVMVLFLIGPLLVDILGPEHRMVRLFLFESDSSLSGRMVLFQQELEFLRSNWVLGRYMYDVVATGVTGNYAHNYMSFLSAYGIGPAVGLVCVIIASLSGGVRQAMHHHHVQAILAVLCFCLLGIVAARSYLYPYIWFALAALASLRFSVADAKAS